MGNCCSRPTPLEHSLHDSGDPVPPAPSVPTARDPSPPPINPSLPISGDPATPPMKVSLPASGDPVTPALPMDAMEPSVSTARDPSSPPMNPSLPASGDRLTPPMEPSLSALGDPAPPIVTIESIGEEYKNIDPQQIDLLVRFIETQLHRMKTPSEAGSSSSEGWLATVRDVTKLSARTLDTISTEAEKLSESYLVKEMGNLTLKIMKRAGELHWGFILLSIAAFAVETYMSVGYTENECRDLLVKIVELTKDVKQFGEQMPDKREKVSNAVATIVEGVVICLGYLTKGKFSRFWSAKTAGEQVEKINEQLKEVRGSLILSVDLETQKQVANLQKQVTKRLEQSPLELLDFKPVGIEEQVREVKRLLDLQGAESALAVIVCGFGGMGKSTLAASAVQSLDWSSTDFKFCRVIIDEKAPDRKSHIIKLQKDIIYDLGGDKVDLRDTDEGRRLIKKALQNNSSFLFIDNVVDTNYIEDLLPIDLSSGQQDQDLKSDVQKKKTKLRILLTSRDKTVKTQLRIVGKECKEYDVQVLSDQASQRLLLDTILPSRVGDDDMDFEEKNMINEVAAACKGVPLLLSVFGNHLRVEREESSYQKESYEEALGALRAGSLDDFGKDGLGTKLLFVYDKIEDEVKEAFLDICSYFHGWEWNLVADIVDPSKLRHLRRRMLVSKGGSGEVIVHDILRSLGTKKAELTRFSNYKDFSDALKKKSDNVRGISFLSEDRLIIIPSTQLEAMHESLRVLMLGDWVALDGPCQEAFPNLRYLRVGDVTAFPFKDPSKLEKLRVLLNRSMAGMNLSHLPSSLKHISHEVPDVECDKFVKRPFQNLSSLKSFNVKTQKSVELPEELHLPASLVNLDLNGCKNLPKDIGHLTTLESLILDGSDLECLPQGFGKLKKLKRLSMDYCSKLTFLSEELGMLSSLEVISMKESITNLTALPQSFGELLSLQTLELEGSINLQLLPESFGELRIHSLKLHSLKKLQDLPNSFGNMPLLKDLSLKSCHSLMSLPNSFVQLEMLETLEISECPKLSVLPKDFGQLRCLKDMTVEECHLLKELPHGFGALPALKIFTLRCCNSFVDLPRDFTELTCLEVLRLNDLPLISRIPDGFGKLKGLRFLIVWNCSQLKTLPDDFEKMATLEPLQLSSYPEVDGAMMEKILKLQNCFVALIEGSTKLEEKWQHMQGESEHPIVVFTGFKEWEKERDRVFRVALLRGKCMEVNNASGELTERSSLLGGLEDHMTATVALIMLPIEGLQSHQHSTLQRFVERARERAESNGSGGKLQIVCARKYTERATARVEEERAEEVHKILVSLPKGSCAIPSPQTKRLQMLTFCCDQYQRHDKLSFVTADVGVNMEGRRSFENFIFSEETDISENVGMEPPRPSEVKKVESKQYNSIQKFIKSICPGDEYEDSDGSETDEESMIQSRWCEDYDTESESESESESECVAGEIKTRELVEALKGNGIDHLLIHNNTTRSKVEVDDLHGKSIGFIICHFKIFECINLQQIYKDLQQKDSNFIAIWIPSQKIDECGHGSYTRLIQCMPWATFPLPQLINVESRNPCFVVLDKDGQIANHDAMPLLLAWGEKSYPFNWDTIPENFSLMEFLLHEMNVYNHPLHPQHRIAVHSIPARHECDVCNSRIGDNGVWSYRCHQCDWDICGRCRVAYGKQEVEQLLPAKQNN